MKSKFSALVICFMMSVAAIAATPTSVLVKAATKESVFNIHYSAIEKGNVKVSILDSNEKSVFNEVLTQVTSFVRPYNFSELPEGEYTIVIEDINGKQAEKINYTLNKITSFINVAKVANEGNKYWLNVANNSFPGGRKSRAFSVNVPPLARSEHHALFVLLALTIAASSKSTLLSVG